MFISSDGFFLSKLLSTFVHRYQITSQNVFRMIVWLLTITHSADYLNRCQRTGHPLQPPLTALDIVNYSGPCPTVGCYGYGHVKGAKFSGHHR